MYNCIDDLLPEKKYDQKSPYGMIPERIVIHNTYGDASAADEIAYMKRNDLQVSYHYAVDDREVRRGIPENRNAWHAGDGNGTGNRSGIGIEICYSKSGGERFLQAEDNAAHFTAALLKKYGWGLEKVTKHQDYSGKYCPHRTLDLGWDRFLKMVEKHRRNLEMSQFKDVNGHWAQKHIETLENLGIVNGDGLGFYRPNEAITRAEVAVIAANVLRYLGVTK